MEAERVAAREPGPRDGIAVAASGDPGRGSEPLEGTAGLAVPEGEHEGERMAERGYRDVSAGGLEPSGLRGGVSP